MKYWFIDEDSESCYNKEYISDEFPDQTEVEVFEAKKDYGSGYFFCKEHGELGESGDSGCGTDCKEYSPRNKVSGRCRFSETPYTYGKKIILKLKPKPKMITSQLTDQQKEFNAKMEEIKKVILQFAFEFGNMKSTDVGIDNATEQIRNILKDSFIPNEKEVKDPFAQVKRDSFWYTVNNIRDEYRQENLKILENLDKLNDRITDLENKCIKSIL